MKKFKSILSITLAAVMCCTPLTAQAGVLLPDGTPVSSLQTMRKDPQPTRKTTSEDTWTADVRFSFEDGATITRSSNNICGYEVGIFFPRVEAELQEALDAKHLEIIEVYLHRFTDSEPWNELEPESQSLYFVVSPWENHGDVRITWQSPGTEKNLAQGFRQTGPRCCFSLSVNEITGYLYSPVSGGLGLKRSHFGYNDNVLLLDDTVMAEIIPLIDNY